MIENKYFSHSHYIGTFELFNLRIIYFEISCTLATSRERTVSCNEVILSLRSLLCAVLLHLCYSLRLVLRTVLWKANSQFELDRVSCPTHTVTKFTHFCNLLPKLLLLSTKQFLLLLLLTLQPWVGLGPFNNSIPLLSILDLRPPTNNFHPL